MKAAPTVYFSPSNQMARTAGKVLHARLLHWYRGWPVQVDATRFSAAQVDMGGIPPLAPQNKKRVLTTALLAISRWFFQQNARILV